MPSIGSLVPGRIFPYSEYLYRGQIVYTLTGRGKGAVEEEPTRDIGKSLPQESRQEHEIVVVHQHYVPFLVDARYCLQKELVRMRIRLRQTEEKEMGDARICVLLTT